MLLNMMYALDDIASEIAVIGLIGPYSYIEEKLEQRKLKKEQRFEDAKKMEETVDNILNGDVEETIEVQFECPELDEEIKKNPEKADGLEYVKRVERGYELLCYTFSTLMQNDDFKDYKLSPREANAVNIIAQNLGVCDLVKTDCKRIKTLKDISFEGNFKNPIICDSIIKDAYRKYPANFVDINNLLKIRDFDPEETVEVIEVEESIVKQEEKEKEKEPAPDPIETVVDTADKIINMTDKIAETVAETVDNAIPSTKKEQPTPPPTIIDMYGRKCIDTTVTDPTPTEYQKNTFEKLFGKYLEKKDYVLKVANGGCLECQVDGRSIFIDPGKCIGNGWNVLGTFLTGNPAKPYDTIPVSASDRDICKKIFQSAYILSDKDIARCKARLFKNAGIYTYIDMSNMHNALKDMSKEDFNKLGDKLTFIINKLAPVEIGRMRFEKFRGVDNFRLISDERCISPFPGDTLVNITGVKVAVKGDEITVYFNGSETKFNYTAS